MNLCRTPYVALRFVAAPPKPIPQVVSIDLCSTALPIYSCLGRTKAICKDTLLIKNLPSDLCDTEKKDLLTHFGAINVKVITSKYKQKSRVFAKFKSEDVAKNVMLRLHQMNILDSTLCVEYAREEIGYGTLQNSAELEAEMGAKHFDTFLNKLNSWNPAVSFHQPPPPHLKYLYPKPNRATINNIAHALASVPKFYTQVLHLMNRMNLPPPFSNIPDPPEVLQQQHLGLVPILPSNVPISPSNNAKHSTSESELESDPEEQKSNQKDIIPVKRTKSHKKVVKKPKFIKPMVVVPSSGRTVQSTEEMFEKVDLQNQKRIEVKVSDNLEAKSCEPEEQIEGFGIIHSQKQIKTDTTKTKDAEEKELKVDKIITEEELTSNRISPKDFGVLSVFKNYHAGAPSCRLYIKNLAKNVELVDLLYIYKRYDTDKDKSEQGNMFDVRLMQEGRMKGQAFVTLRNVAAAQKAVKETNGFILKNKPLVVVFARSAVPKTK